jgi:ureidoglycolate hydrolase
MFEEYGDIVTVEDLSEMLCIGKNAAYKLVSNGIVKGFKQGAIWKIPKLAVINYVKEQSNMI